MNAQDDFQRMLHSLSPITLSELDGVALMNRVDTKYVLSEELLPDLLAAVSEEYRALEVDGVRCAPYSTLYYDTPESACYLAHHNGKGSRYKYRARSYVASDASFFEVKHRTNKGRTVKNRTSVPSIPTTLDAQSAEFAAEVTGREVPLEPMMWTQFSRTTLAGIQALERVTIDVDLEFSAGEQTVDLPGVAIVEVKQERSSRDSPIRRELREMRVAPMSMSKYCIGRALLDPTLKRNRFKIKLLALRTHAHEKVPLDGNS